MTLITNTGSADFHSSSNDPFDVDVNQAFVYSFDDLSSFEEYINEMNQNFHEQVVGMFPTDSLKIDFFKDKDSEKILNEIRLKNEKEKAGNVKIPGTELEFINYSYCPNCEKIYSFSDLIKYYNKPVPNAYFKVKGQQTRKDTSVCCDQCHTYFLPALVIIKGDPLASVQFLCRMQTINAVEEYYLNKYDKKVLTLNTNNLIKRDNKNYILNDVLLSELAEKPALILNLLQYSPFDLMIKMILGENIKEGDYLFQSVRFFPA
jgi:hypothetical protein